MVYLSFFFCFLSANNCILISFPQPPVLPALLQEHTPAMLRLKHSDTSYAPCQGAAAAATSLKKFLEA